MSHRRNSRRRAAGIAAAAITSSSALLLAASPTVTVAKADKAFDLVYRGSYDPAERGAEIVTVDPASRRMFVAAGNRIDIVDIADITSPIGLASTAYDPDGDDGDAWDVTSVSVRNGVLAAAFINPDKTAAGRVAFFDLDGALLSSVAVGAVPDMIVHSPDGSKLAVAGEGEPECVNGVFRDAPGTIGIVDLTGAAGDLTDDDVTLVTFDGFESAELRAAGVRLFGPSAGDPSLDLEPESVTWSQNGQTIWSSLQEANAVATVDVRSATVTSITGLGYLDHSVAANALDASDRDGSGNNPAFNITTWPIKGMYQPDVIDAFQLRGRTYLATANEGDSRDYGTCYIEEARGGAFANAVLGRPLAGLDADGDNSLALADNDELNRFQGTNAFPQAAGTTTDPITHLYGFGSRSVSIRDAATGAIVWDSAGFIERYVAQQPGAVDASNPFRFFNANFGKSIGEGFDTRSDNKGAEPEGLVVGKFDGRTLVFVGLERANGIMFWDVTNPAAPVFQEWERQVQYGATPTGDLAPEGLAFVPAEQSWTGSPLLIVSHEADQGGTNVLQTRTSIYELTVTTTGGR